MTIPAKSDKAPDKRLAAVCGLFCPACRVYIATSEDPGMLREFAERAKLSEEEMKCLGCRSDTLSHYCRTCNLKTCAKEKGIDFCGECGEYPCEELKSFQAAMPHRIELWKSLEEIRNNGYEQWFYEKVQDYSCPQCQSINSTYDLTCRKCGNEPSCAYVGRHRGAIARYFEKGK